MAKSDSVPASYGACQVIQPLFEKTNVFLGCLVSPRTYTWLSRSPATKGKLGNGYKPFLQFRLPERRPAPVSSQIFRFSVSWPLWASHTFSVLSLLPLTIRCLASELNAARPIPSDWSVSHRRRTLRQEKNNPGCSRIFARLVRRITTNTSPSHPSRFLAIRQEESPTVTTHIVLRWLSRPS